MQISRRRFLATSALAAPSMAFSIAQATRPSETVRIAIVGLRYQGRLLVKYFARVPQAHIVALCDVDSEILAKVAGEYEEELGPFDLFKDYRKLLERKDIDAVVIATPNHWHALQTIWACQAGKDVYVEKPCAHNIWEGRKMIEAARKYNRIVQVGLHSSSDTGLPEVAQWIREGHIGKIKAIHTFWYKPRDPIGMRATPLTLPPTIDYDQWLGPASDEPLYRDNLHYDWHWDWNTGNGEMGNLGVHAIDLARYFLGDPLPPKNVTTFGNRFGPEDAGDTPNLHVAAYDFEEAPVILELNNFHLKPGSKRRPAFHKIGKGQVIICEGGEFRGHAHGKVYDNKGQVIKKFTGAPRHEANFIEAVISRKRETLNCEVERGHQSSALALLGGISWRAGQQASAKHVQGRISDNPWLSESFKRYNEQADNWGFNATRAPWVYCDDLNYDAAQEQFVGNRANEANPLLKRQSYRPGFEVPEQV